MTTATRTPPHHDTLTCYADYRCRRPDCVARMRAYEQRRRAGQAAGTWQPFVPAAPVRHHLLALQAAGITAFRVAALTGLPDRTIRGFTERQRNSKGRLLGLRQRTTPSVAAAILAVTPDPAAAGKVSTTASRRRIQALIAAGWPLLHIAARSSLAYTTLTGAMRQPLILRGTADAITAAYDDLRDRRPGRCGIAAHQAKKARTRAASHGWPPPDYWDHPDHPIDDPAFAPQSAGQAIAEEARWLMTIGGLDVGQAARRLSRSYAYVANCLRDHPADDGQVAA